MQLEKVNVYLVHMCLTSLIIRKNYNIYDSYSCNYRTRKHHIMNKLSYGEYLIAN